MTIENINWHLEQGKGVYESIMDGARQITQPAFVSLLCICVAFVPMFALTGVAGYLFVPLSLPKAMITTTSSTRLGSTLKSECDIGTDRPAAKVVFARIRVANAQILQLPKLIQKIQNQTSVGLIDKAGV